MLFETFGDKDKPVALLIHGIFYPGSTSYKTLIPLLEKDYYVLVPHLEGINYPVSKFISSMEQSNEIVKWLKENNINKISFLLGSSFGTSVAFELMKELWLQIDIVAFDGPTLKNSKYRGTLFYMELNKLVGDIKKYGMKAFDKWPRYNHISTEDKIYIKNVFENISSETIKKIAFSCYHYKLPSQLFRENTKITFLIGDRDRSKKNLPELKILAAGDIKIIKDMSHLEFMFKNPLKFLEECGLYLDNK
ncbi:alpha/beta fold hydrolase [Peptostreptococcus equinus]|uniref:Alpha/beta hydrolase n=1 Tax=Peptostreptococcus equinus TaxID=3003601 RepID=A0ABY7JV09_9FIRM|nr:alpha/beta hydrolase [Peptostreptococcus sp. CBA3647]WAW15825.1 alpha/beta hydrolase [Peptostreptococcus sp. CBA3647]